MSDPSPSSNPFVDPNDTQLPMADSTSIRSTRGHDLLEATLAVGRNASLTLGTDSLIVLGECELRLIYEKTNANFSAGR